MSEPRVALLVDNRSNREADFSDAYGPEVNYAGAGSSDILSDYVAAAFGKAGYATVISADSRPYHDGDGNIHCGTNVRRAIPAYLWWEK